MFQFQTGGRVSIRGAPDAAGLKGGGGGGGGGGGVDENGSRMVVVVIVVETIVLYRWSCDNHFIGPVD